MNQKTYLNTTGLEDVFTPARTSSSAKGRFGAKAREAALTRAHDIRKFEIELYWKRANHFWVLQAAVFAALGLTWNSAAPGLVTAAPVVFAALGVITAAAGWFSAQGSKFWQENWEHHIDMLEDEFEGRLHKTTYVGRSGLRWSVSGVNDRLALCFLAFWLVALIVISWSINPNWTFKGHDFVLAITQAEVLTLISWAFAGVGLISMYFRATELRGSRIDYPVGPAAPLTQKKRPRLFPGNGQPYLVAREPKT